MAQACRHPRAGKSKSNRLFERLYLFSARRTPRERLSEKTETAMTITPEQDNPTALTDSVSTGPASAWEQIAPGRFMPRRVRGSYQGRALG